MSIYQPPVNEVFHLLNDVLHIPARLETLPVYTDSCDNDLIAQVLEEMGKFVGEVVAPLNRDGDEVGCVFDDGSVITPPGFADAYRQFWQAGWPAIATATEDGGQGLPAVLEAVMYEWLNGANHGWTMAPGLLHGVMSASNITPMTISKAGTLKK